MNCPHCRKAIAKSPWIVLLQQLGTLGIVTFWFSRIVGTWDDEPWVLAAIFVTMLSFAFGGEKGLEFARNFLRGGKT